MGGDGSGTDEQLFTYHWIDLSGCHQAKDFYLALAAVVVIGAAMVSVLATVNSLIQTLVPDNVRGRVLSWHTMSYLGLHPVGSLIIGKMAEQWSTSTALAVWVTIPLVLVLALFFAVPELRHLE